MKKYLSPIISFFKIIFTAYILFFAGIYLFQEKLIFYPVGISKNDLEYIHRNYPDVKEFYIEANDGKKLHGWVIDNSAKKNYGLVFYFGGNAEEVSHRIREMKKLQGWTVILANYRGYGLSEGKPGQKVLFEDALIIYDHFRYSKNHERSKVVSMGWSLGTGIAVYLAHERDVDGVFLVSPYDSITNIAKKQYPFIPVKRAIRHPFDSASIAASIKTPVRIIYGSQDRIIPPANTLALATKWGGPVDVFEVTGTSHNFLTTSPQYLNYFLESFEFFSKDRIN